MATGAWHNITLVGLGSQGQAWAQNLRDSGHQVRCYLRPDSPSWSRAEALAFEASRELNTLLQESRLLLLLIPDHQHADFLKENQRNIPKDTVIIYAHGASMVEHGLDQTYPQWTHLLLAPKAIASELRSAYQQGAGLGAVYSADKVTTEKREFFKKELLHLAKNLGITAGPYEVTFEQETRADLLSEQTLLCGLLPYAAKSCFDTLVKNDIPSELAYLEAWHEVKLIANAMIELGPSEFFNLISPHALIGARFASKELFDKGYQETIEKLRQDIWSGAFFEEVRKLSINEERKDLQREWRESQLQKTFEKLKSGLNPTPKKS